MMETLHKFGRVDKFGIHIIFHVMMVNTEDMSEETRDIGFGKSNA